jgi:hypothetical protein
VQVFDTAELGQEKEFFFLLYRTKQRLPTLAAGVRFFFPQKAADVPWTFFFSQHCYRTGQMLSR